MSMVKLRPECKIKNRSRWLYLKKSSSTTGMAAVYLRFCRRCVAGSRKSASIFVVCRPGKLPSNSQFAPQRWIFLRRPPPATARGRVCRRKRMIISTQPSREPSANPGGTRSRGRPAGARATPAGNSFYFHPAAGLHRESPALKRWLVAGRLPMPRQG